MERIAGALIVGALGLFILAATFGIIVISLDTLEEYKKSKKRNRL